MSNVTSRNPEIAPLAFEVLGSEKWGYYVKMWDAGVPEGDYLELCRQDRFCDWPSKQEAATKAAAVLRELADLLEASV